MGTRTAVALAIYSGIAVLFFAPLLADLDSTLLADDIFIRDGVSDAYNALWTFWWIQHAASELRDPLFCDWVLPPTGVDLALHSHVLFPTLAAIPVASLFGAVAGYNLMVLFLLVGGALAMFLVSHLAFGFRSGSALFGGLLFGFCPYFVFKAHAHPNLLGSLFWVPLLGILYYAYSKQRFSLALGWLLALFATLVFWTSLVELFMVVCIGGLSVVVWEVVFALRGASSKPAVRSRLRLLAPSLLALSLSALFLFSRVDLGLVAVPLYPAPGLADLLSPSPLHFLSRYWRSETYEFWGLYLPVGVLLLAALGLVRKRGPLVREVRIGLTLLAATALLLACRNDAAELLRDLTHLTDGFRVYSRFFPFAMFFLALLATAGFDAARRLGGKAGLALVLSSIALVLFEYFPYNLDPSRVFEPELSAAALAVIPKDQVVLLWPEDRRHRPVHDTFQVAIERRVVQLSFTARQDPRARRVREGSQAAVYELPDRVTPAWLATARGLSIGFVYFEDARDLRRLEIPHEVVARGSTAALVALSDDDSQRLRRPRDPPAGS